MDKKKVISWVEGLAENDWRLFHSDSEVQNIAKAVLALLKEQEQEIAFLKKMQLQTIGNMSEEDIGNSVAKILGIKGW
jgi:hypothetical protein